MHYTINSLSSAQIQSYLIIIRRGKQGLYNIHIS